MQLMGLRRQTVTGLAAVLVAAACATAPSSPSPAPDAASPGRSAPPTRSAPPSSSSDPVPSLPPASPAPAGWSAIGASGATPRAREDHTWTVGEDGTAAYLFGGRDGARVLDDLFVYDLGTDRWRRLDSRGPRPAARFGHEAAWVPGIGLVVFAGQAGPATFFGDLWAYDPAADRWRRLPDDGDRPVPRYGTCSALGTDGRLWISHGFTQDGTRFSDTRAYDFRDQRWSDETPDGDPPVARCLHGCFVADDGRFVLYAGQTTGVQALGDLWALAGPGTAGASWEPVDGSLPPERNLYAYARTSRAWVVVGGRGPGSRYLADAHVVDATTLAVTPLRTRGPRPAARAGAALIADGDRLLLFGGTDGNGAFGDLWQLDLGGGVG